MLTRFFGLCIFCKGQGHKIISKGILMVMKGEKTFKNLYRLISEKVKGTVHCWKKEAEKSL